jgi:hypothetical protein
MPSGFFSINNNTCYLLYIYIYIYICLVLFFGFHIAIKCLTTLFVGIHFLYVNILKLPLNYLIFIKYPSITSTTPPRVALVAFRHFQFVTFKKSPNHIYVITLKSNQLSSQFEVFFFKKKITYKLSFT